MTAIGDPGTIFDRGSGSAFRRPIVRLLLRPELPSLVFLVVLVVVFSVTAQGFLTGANVQQIFEQVAILGIVALGLNQVILAGEIDVSMGSLLAVCAATAASVSNHVGGLVAPLAVSLAIGGAAGLLNGLLVTKARIPSIIVTLAGLYALRGAEQVLNAIGIDSVPPGVQGLGSGHILGLDSAVSVLVLCFVGVYLISRHTTWGREVSAVGGNRSAARMAGLRVDRVRLWAFVLVGLCVGLAAMVYIGEVGAVQSNAETGFELQAIAAVVIGGTSISGGRGSPLAALAGALLIGTMLDGMNLLGVVERWQDFFTGSVILLAVASDVVRRHVVRRVATL